LKPGFSETVTVDQRPSTEKAIAGDSSWSGIEEIVLCGGTPAHDVSVRIVAVAPLEEKAVADTRSYRWPAEGTTIPVTVNQGQSIAEARHHNYSIRLTEPAVVSGGATATVSYEEQELRGTISSYEAGRPEEGDVVRATTKPQTTATIAWFGQHDDRIELTEQGPVRGKVDVEMVDATHPLEGTITTYETYCPSVGETVRAYVESSTKTVYADPVEFDGLLKLPAGAETTGFATIEITEVSSVIEGKIVNYEGDLEVGDTVRAEVTQGASPQTATTLAGGYEVNLSENVLASGEVLVEIEEDGPPYRGTITSYEGLVPKEGDHVFADVESGITLATADPHHRSYSVYLSGDSTYEGAARVEITEVADRIKGEIVEEIDPDQKTGRKGNSPFKSPNNSLYKNRKKH
jgi:hypothetical protein